MAQPGHALRVGANRLSIIDIAGGQQPMVSHDGRYVITFNGEIYNYRALRAELIQRGARFQTNSDTEVILEAFRAWGTGCVQRFHGMFAFALLDTQTRTLLLARDPTGIKPLYYADTPDGFFFGSELKAILASPHVPRRLNYQALADFFVLSYPLMPKTFFADCLELEPGTWMEITTDRTNSARYWHWQRQEASWDKLLRLMQLSRH
ncbi:MAG: hypothetical protein HC876_12565 [Chloroflexaceae bacterium]|nr:hypothetical protein [Chloroflexaceae bacterium]